MRDSHSRFAALSSGHRWCPSISCCENAADVKRRHPATMSADILRSRLPWNAVIRKPKACAPEQQHLRESQPQQFKTAGESFRSSHHA